MRMEPGEGELKEIKTVMARLMKKEGFLPDEKIHPELPEVADATRSIKFGVNIDGRPANIGYKLKIKNFLGLISDKKIRNEKFFDRMRKIREDIPFSIEVRFRTIIDEEREGYEVELTAIPTILMKRRQGLRSEISSGEASEAVGTAKNLIPSLMSNFEAETLLEPQTRAELIQNSLESDKRAILEKLEYGNKVIMHIDEADSCLRNNLLHSALNSYVHAIEWLIICYLNKEESIDIIREEEQGEEYYFYDLIGEIKENANIPQKTASKLENLNSAERRWIAHHKSGSIVKSDVINVKERFQILLEEIF